MSENKTESVTPSKVYKVRILNGNHEVESTREVEHKEFRLDLETFDDLYNKSHVNNYMTIRVDSAASGSSDSAGNQSMEIDTGAWKTARENAIAEATRVLFGLHDVPKSKVVAEDFAALRQVVREKDIFGFKDQDETSAEAKKKLS